MFGTLDRTPPHWPKAPSTPAEASFPMPWSITGAASSARAVPQAAGEPAWQPYGTDANYMAFKDAPVAGTHLLPGMYTLHEEVVCRRRANGSFAWNWNIGLVSPPLPSKGSCGQ